MKSQITLAVLASMTLLMAVTVAIPYMNSVVFASDDYDDKDKDKDKDRKSHGCEKKSQGYKSSDGKCFHRD